MNQNGYSWTEAILTVTILSVVFSTLLPIATHITMNLQKKKYAMHAAETLYHGAIAYRAHGLSMGDHQIDKMNYHWTADEREVCVSYTIGEKGYSKCIDSN